MTDDDPLWALAMLADSAAARSKNKVRLVIIMVVFPVPTIKSYDHVNVQFNDYRAVPTFAEDDRLREVRELPINEMRASWNGETIGT